MRTLTTPERARLRVCVRGAVQGVGFRPFVYRLATELDLKGWVNNSAHGVTIEVEGPRAQLERFLLRIEAEKPAHSFVQSLESSWLDPAGYAQFEIRESDGTGEKTVLVLPDIATCPECRFEVFDPANRRYRYPFTNCTHCGPRFSIIEALPYDRANTSMKGFTMCGPCRAEYDDPRDRRFHAQPNACPVCGPHLELWNCDGKRLSGAGPALESVVNESGQEIRRRSHERSDQALRAAADAIRQGRIVAVKGLGGFQLMAAAHDTRVIRRLRELKHREEKPFALMFPTLQSVRAHCEVAALEERLLRSPESPIVLLQRRKSESRSLRCEISDCVAPGNPHFGAMLPYTPLHHLLLAELAFPVVATSGNLSDEPICTDDLEAIERLGGIADQFLVHNRPIVRYVDDSVARIILGRELVLRRARGYAPLPIQLKSAARGAARLTATSDFESRTSDRQNVSPCGGGHDDAGRASAAGDETRPPSLPASATSRAIPQIPIAKSNAALLRAVAPARQTILAVGAHLKNTVALMIDRQVFVSQHIGDLDTVPAFAAFEHVIADFERLYECRPVTLVADLHPDYLSTKFAQESGRPVVGVQHHLAHIFSCMAENELEPPVLGVSWDGTGYGLDGTVWGGEFFLVTDSSSERVAHFRPFRLPGGEQAVKEPRRAALGLLHPVFGDGLFERRDLAPVSAFSQSELATLRTMLARGLNSPLTSSVGRLFDAVASVIGLRQRARFEGQAAMELEFGLHEIETDECYRVQSAECRVRSHARPASQSGIGTSPPALILDWSPMIQEILTDLNRGIPPGKISAKFHNALTEAIVLVARRIDAPRVALSGGCFQNRYLTERTVFRLEEEGFRVYWHQRIPPNDGGISLGQIVAALRARE